MEEEAMSVGKFMKNTLFEYADSFMEALPGFFSAILILFIGWLLAKIISKGLNKLLKKIKFDDILRKLNINELGGDKDIAESSSLVVSKFVYYFIFLIFISMSVQKLGMQIITDQMNALIEFFPQVFVAVLIFLIGFYISTLIRNMITSTTRSMGMAAGGIIGNAIFYFLLIVVSITALEQLGIDTLLITSNLSILIAGIIVAGALAYGLAAIDTMGNILSVFFAKKTFAVGQYVRIGEVEGQIIQINSVNIVLAQKGKKIIIPAKNFTKENVIISIDSVKEIDE